MGHPMSPMTLLLGLHQHTLQLNLQILLLEILQLSPMTLLLELQLEILQPNITMLLLQMERARLMIKEPSLIKFLFKFWQNTQDAQPTTVVAQQQAPGGKAKRGRPSKKSDVAVPVAPPASGPGIVPNPHAPHASGPGIVPIPVATPASGPGIVPIPVAPPVSDPANVPIPVAPTADQLTNPEGQLTVLKNAFDTTMFMMSHYNTPTLPPNIVEASNIIKELLDNATATCAPSNTTGCEDGGTQQSAVTNIEHQKEHQGGVDYNPSN
ncbi:hypothetical protein SESBI_35572 [Sesbania bispinosa]|nr:hypothetical protein SESBI_35572 [Sesbania bispinosa]